MTDENNPISILLFSDEPEEFEAVGALLDSQQPPLHVAQDAAQAQRLFEAQQHCILLFDFVSLEGAERLHLDLCRNSELIYSIPHQSVLLCNIKDAKQAYEICERAIFDDYVVHKPLYDPHRLNLSIKLAKDRLRACRTGEGSGQLHRLERELSDAQQEMQHTLAKGQTVQQQNRHTLNQLNQVLRQKMHGLADELETQGPVRASQLLSSFGDQQVQQEIEQTQRTIEQQVGVVINEISAQSARQENSLQTLSKLAEKTPPTILLVEDNAFDQELVQNTLKQQGLQVLKAINGASAMKLLTSNQVDLMLLDYELPDMSGLELLEKMRANTQFKDLPVIINTGHRKRELVEAAVRLGACDFIIKPLQQKTLTSKVMARLGMDVSHVP